MSSTTDHDEISKNLGESQAVADAWKNMATLEARPVPVTLDEAVDAWMKVIEAYWNDGTRKGE